MYTHLEDYIYALYTSIGVKSPNDLDMKFIAKQLGVDIIYRQRTFRFDNEIVLVKSTKRKEWIEFGHEICHYLRHAGSQLNMGPMFRELQEWQADYFAYHFCVPTFMLLDFDFPKYTGQAIQQIADSFNVTLEFARTRFNMYKSKHIQYVTQNAFAHSMVTESEILNDEFYDTFNLEENAAKKIQETVDFWHYLQRRKIT